MTDTQETGAEVIAEYRADADKMDSHELPQPTTQYLRIMLDRFDAAHKRERGDAAKLREALVKCRDIALQWQADEAAGVAGTTDKPHARSAAEAVVDMEFEINAALSTPPRNCDLPEVAKDPWRAWLDDKSNWDEFGSPKLEIHEWLLAPATEKEGGAK